MESYIYREIHGRHILDLTQTIPLLKQALVALSNMSAQHGQILFVGTKRQARDAVALAAQDCGQHYVNQRWFGGTLTNWASVSGAIAHFRGIIDAMASPPNTAMTKKELIDLRRKHDRLERSFGGIRNMDGVPDLLFVIDTNKDAIAVSEARKIGIPVVAILDSNSDPSGIAYPIPANDDSRQTISLVCSLAAQAINAGRASHAVQTARTSI